MITARLTLNRPDGSREEHRLELPGEDAWVPLLDRLEARWGPGVGDGGPVDPTVAAVLANPGKAENSAEDAPERPRTRPRAPGVGLPPLEADSQGAAPTTGGVRDTSRDAYDQIKVRGKLTRQQTELVAYLQARPERSFTRAELGQAIGWRINVVCGRVNELLQEPFPVLEEIARRRCGVTGESAMALKLR